MKKLYCSELDEITEREITESTFVIDGYAVGDCIYGDSTEIEELMNLTNFELHKNYDLIPPINPKFKFNTIKR